MFTPATSVQEFPASITLLTFTFTLLLLLPPPVWSNAIVLKTTLYFSPKSHRLSIKSCENLQQMKQAVKWSSDRSKCWLQSLLHLQDCLDTGIHCEEKNDVNCMKYGDFRFLTGIKDEQSRRV